MRQTLKARHTASKRKYQFGAYPGRFQIPHEIHIRNFRQGLDVADHMIGVLGSDEQSRDLRNSFTSSEREEMIRGSLTAEENSRLTFIRQRDVGDRARWSAQVQAKIDGVIQSHGFDHPDIAILGCKKDSSSQYLDDFPVYDLIEIEPVDNVSSSHIRDEFFRIGGSGYADPWLRSKRGVVPEGTLAFLEKFIDTDAYARLQIEAEKHDDYAKGWENTPYPVIFNTADAMIVQGPYVLMVKRRNYPGKDYWALPGGFVEYRQRIFDAALDETFQETSLDISRTQLKEAFLESWVEDDPWRSTRGRTITHPHLFLLQPKPRGKTASERHASMLPPRVRGTDDAEVAEFKHRSWIDQNRSMIMEDHAIIIDKGYDRLARYIGR